MLLLPSLCAEPGPGRLPLSESSAMRLATALLEADGARAAEALIPVLRDDPSLTLWCVLQRNAAPASLGTVSHSPASLNTQSPTLRELADWLVEHAVARLQWPAAEVAAWSDFPIDEEGAGERAEASFLPRLMAQLARSRQLEADFQRTLETEKLEAMAEFAAGAGHEINNPLAIIAGRAQLLLRGESDPERQRDLAIINTQAMRVYEMIADMMLFARPPLPECAEVDVEQLLAQVAADMQAKLTERRIQLECLPLVEPLRVWADPTQLTVALRALCDNALQALASGGQIWLAASSSAEGSGLVEISVRDDGPGIADDVRRHLFDPYYSGRAAGRGLGLGLSKCWRIAALHGGRLDVDSEPGRGTTFRLRLPAAAARPALTSMKATSAAAPPIQDAAEE